MNHSNQIVFPVHSRAKRWIAFALLILTALLVSACGGSGGMGSEGVALSTGTTTAAPSGDNSAARTDPSATEASPSSPAPKPVASFDFQPRSVILAPGATLVPGDKKSPRMIGRDSEGQPTSGWSNNLQWRSENPSVVTVSSAGSLKSVGYGSTLVHVLDPNTGAKGSFKVSVVHPVFSPRSLYLNPEETRFIQLVDPASGGSVIMPDGTQFLSSKPGIVEFVSFETHSGVLMVKGKLTGDTMISASHADLGESVQTAVVVGFEKSLTGQWQTTIEEKVGGATEQGYRTLNGDNNLEVWKLAADGALEHASGKWWVDPETKKLHMTLGRATACIGGAWKLRQGSEQYEYAYYFTDGGGAVLSGHRVKWTDTASSEKAEVQEVWSKPSSPYARERPIEGEPCENRL